MKYEVSIPNIRWIMHLKNGKMVVENHDHGRTWKRVLKENYGNIVALCFQILPEAIKYYVPESPFGEYWQFDEFEVHNGGSSKHTMRGLASKQENIINEHGVMTAKWAVLLINSDKQAKEVFMTSEEIGYETIHFVNAQDKLKI